MIRARSEAPRAQKQVSFQHCQLGAHFLLLDSTHSPALLEHGRTDSQVPGGKGDPEGNHKNKVLMSNLGDRDSPWPQGTQEALEILEISWHQLPESSGHCQTLGCRSEL